jgi:hypothetical protein
MDDDTAYLIGSHGVTKFDKKSTQIRPKFLLTFPSKISSLFPNHIKSQINIPTQLWLKMKKQKRRRNENEARDILHNRDHHNIKHGFDNNQPCAGADAADRSGAIRARTVLCPPVLGPKTASRLSVHHSVGLG